MKKRVKSRKSRQRGLSSRILTGYGIAAIVLITLICLAVGQQYWKMETEEYADLAYSYADTAAEYIDGDRITEYLEGVQEDEYYLEVLSFLESIQSNSDLDYFYVFIPAQDGVLYIWDAGYKDSKGTIEPYDEGEKEYFEELLQGNAQRTITISFHEEYGSLATANALLYNSAGEPVAIVGADMSLQGLVGELMHFTSIIILCVVAVVIVSMSIFYSYIRRNIIRPITLLSSGARKMTQNLETGGRFEADIHTGDEIEELSNSFSEMDSELREYIDKISLMGAELNVAAQIQSDMLPRRFPAFPDRKEFDIFATMIPAREVGGDFYDFFMVDDDHLMLVIADVSGKGVPAALFMMTAKTLLKNTAEQGRSPAEVLRRVNDILCENNDKGMFVTVWLGLLEISTGKLTCANAGHDDPILISDGEAKIIRQRHGILMAQIENTPYCEQELTLRAGDTLFLYTDGVTEAATAENKLFGKERLLTSLGRASQESPEGLLRAVKKDMDSFVGEAPQFDDITMLSLKISRSSADLEELKAEPILENIGLIADFAENTLSALKVNRKALTYINIAVDELFSNIAAYSGASEFSIACGVRDGKAIVRFTDNGIPYDPTKAAEPDIKLGLDERGEGGMGIFMVKQKMDSMRYERTDGCNILTIEKLL